MHLELSGCVLHAATRTLSWAVGESIPFSTVPSGIDAPGANGEENETFSPAENRIAVGS
jgi:hypothetical protein